MSHKIVVNKCYGGFSLSPKAAKMMGLEVDELSIDFGAVHCREIPRHSTELVKVVEDMGKEASGSYAKLQIEVIKGNLYQIGEYDGMEWVETPESQEWIEIE